MRAKVAQVNMHQAKSQLSSLVSRSLKGEKIVIAKDGEPLVKLVPVPKKQKSKKKIEFGQLRGQIWISDDFDSPMTLEEISKATMNAAS